LEARHLVAMWPQASLARSVSNPRTERLPVPNRTLQGGAL